MALLEHVEATIAKMGLESVVEADNGHTIVRIKAKSSSTGKSAIIGSVTFPSLEHDTEFARSALDSQIRDAVNAGLGEPVARGLNG